jgi:hypothetical protein
MSTPTAPAASDGFDDLDALLLEATKEATEKAAVKTAKARIARGGPTPSEFLADHARVKAWEDQNEWRKVANVAKFTCTDCSCGEYTGVFTGFFLKEEHRHLRGTFRYLPQTGPMPATLPNLTVQEVVHTQICTACALEKGWDMSKAEQWGQ